MKVELGLVQDRVIEPQDVVVIDGEPEMFVIALVSLMPTNVPVNHRFVMIGVGCVAMFLRDGRRHQVPRQQGHGDDGTDQTTRHAVIICGTTAGVNCQ